MPPFGLPAWVTDDEGSEAFGPLAVGHEVRDSDTFTALEIWNKHICICSAFLCISLQFLCIYECVFFTFFCFFKFQNCSEQLFSSESRAPWRENMEIECKLNAPERNRRSMGRKTWNLQSTCRSRAAPETAAWCNSAWLWYQHPQKAEHSQKEMICPWKVAAGWGDCYCCVWLCLDVSSSIFWLIHLCVYLRSCLPVYLAIHLFVYVFICIYLGALFLSLLSYIILAYLLLSIYPSCPSFLRFPTYPIYVCMHAVTSLSIDLSIHLFIYIHLSIYPIDLSTRPSVYPSIYFSVYVFLHLSIIHPFIYLSTQQRLPVCWSCIFLFKICSCCKHVHKKVSQRNAVLAMTFDMKMKKSARWNFKAYTVWGLPRQTDLGWPMTRDCSWRCYWSIDELRPAQTQFCCNLTQCRFETSSSEVVQSARSSPLATSKHIQTQKLHCLRQVNCVPFGELNPVEMIVLQVSMAELQRVAELQVASQNFLRENMQNFRRTSQWFESFELGISQSDPICPPRGKTWKDSSAGHDAAPTWSWDKGCLVKTLTYTFQYFGICRKVQVCGVWKHRK